MPSAPSSPKPKRKPPEHYLSETPDCAQQRGRHSNWDDVHARFAAEDAERMAELNARLKAEHEAVVAEVRKRKAETESPVRRCVKCLVPMPGYVAFKICLPCARIG